MMKVHANEAADTASKYINLRQKSKLGVNSRLKLDLRLSTFATGDIKKLCKIARDKDTYTVLLQTGKGQI